MKNHCAFSNILLKKGVNEFLANLFPEIKIEKKAYQFLNLMITSYLDNIIQNCSIFIQHRKGEIFQVKDFSFFLFLYKKRNLPNLKLFDKKILKKNSKKKKSTIKLPN